MNGIPMLLVLLLSVGALGAQAKRKHGDLRVFGEGIMGSFYTYPRGVQAKILYNATSVPATTITFTAEAWGTVLGSPREKPFNPKSNWARLTLYRGNETVWGFPLKHLDGKWSTSKARPDHKLLRGSANISYDLARSIIYGPQNFYFLLSWASAYYVDRMWALRAQLGDIPPKKQK